MDKLPFTYKENVLGCLSVALTVILYSQMRNKLMLHVSNNYVWSDNDIQYFMVNDKCRISGTSWVINLLQLCIIFPD